MRSLVRKYKSLWLGCLLLAMACCPALAASSGEITQVKFEPQERRVVIASKGTVGKHLARVIGRPNRLVMDFENMTVGKVPPKITGDKEEIHEIRVSNHKSNVRVVVDFQNRPVPAFQVRRGENQVFVIFGNSLAASAPAAQAAPENAGSRKSSLVAPLAPDFVTAAAKAPGNEKKAPGLTSEKAAVEGAKGSWNKSAGESKAKHPALKEVKLAQSIDLNRPQSSGPLGKPSEGPSDASRPPARDVPAPERPGRDPQMVREVRPPVTPPTPDPRLVVQEITELKFIQVGHNARLIVRGGDNLDYRLNKVSPTKARLDLVNAEIPKAYQNPLKTALFSTSVEMIVPGSQTIFIQLKDAVPYQVEKQKGVLMIDFPPPRFSASPDRKSVAGAPGTGDLAGRQTVEQSRETRMQAFRIMREEEVRKENDTRRRNIESLQKQQEELQKQRTEILKRYQVTTDPEIFNKPVTMDFQGISLRNAFRLLAEQAGINIIVGNEVTGTTTVRLFQVPLGQVIDTILNTHNLDREMMGNVMRVGSKLEMQKYKAERLKEYERRIKEVDTRLANIAKEVQKEQDTSEKALKELEKKEAGLDERADDTKTEEYGEAGCVSFKERGERREVCFYYATVKLIYANPVNILDTLDCMFNLQCAGARRAALVQQAASGALGIATAAPGAVAGSSGTTLPSSTPGLPSSVLAQERQQQITATGTARQGLAQQSLAMRPVGGPGPARALPPGTSEELITITSNNMLAPDVPNRMIFIKDTAERIAQMKKVIATLDIPTPQVLIEGRIVEATRNWARGLGVMWGGRNNQNGPIVDGKTTFWGITGNQAGPTANTATGQTTAGDNIPSTFAVNLPASVTGLGNLMGLGMQFGLLGTQYITELDMRINLGEHTDDARVIARPKVQVLDNQKASIKKGNTIPFSTVSANGTQTQLVDADLLLEVTPKIYADGRINLKIKMTDNSPTALPTVTGTVISTQEAETNMIVKDGETAVIGGIIRNANTNSRDGWPGLMNIPVVNLFFTNKATSKQLQELLVFVTPIIIKRPPPAS
ncbi:MAG: AMIN domain-containing protein [Desulfomonilaceae bacterium]